MTKRAICLLYAVLGLMVLGGQALAHPGGITAPGPDLPPPGVYLSPQDVHAKYGGQALQIVLSAVQHLPFKDQPPREVCDPVVPGPCDEHHDFDSTVNAMVQIGNDAPMPIQLHGRVQTVAFDKALSQTTGAWDTEMLAMDLTAVGMPNVKIRESPSRPSLGRTSIEDVGSAGPPDGPYHIDSFFDVFTELSLDGGQTWMPKLGPRGTRVVLGGVPEPGSIVLLTLGLLSVCGMARRRN